MPCLHKILEERLALIEQFLEKQETTSPLIADRETGFLGILINNKVIRLSTGEFLILLQQRFNN